MLTLQPTYSDMTRQQIEEFLEQVRARRLAASMEYHQGQTIKLHRAHAVLERRIKQQYELLGKELIRLEELDDKIQNRLNKLSIMLQETETIEGLL